MEFGTPQKYLINGIFFHLCKLFLKVFICTKAILNKHRTKSIYHNLIKYFSCSYQAFILLINPSFTFLLYTHINFSPNKTMCHRAGLNLPSPCVKTQLSLRLFISVLNQKKLSCGLILKTLSQKTLIINM